MPDITNDTPVEGLGHFFDTIWQKEEGFVYLPTLDRASDTWKKTMFKWPNHREHVINHVLGKTAQGLDVYYAPAIFSEPKPTKEFVKGASVVWTEYDGSAPKEWPSQTSEGPDGATVDAVVPPPTLRIQSSSDDKQHVYWQLDAFCSDIEWLENTNRSITYSTRADTSGWDATQVLRPPFTRNYKYAENPPVTIAYASRVKYDQGRFSQLKPVKQLVADGINTEDLPTVENVIAKYSWDMENFKFFMDPTIEEGKRSYALMRLGYIGAEMGLNDTEIYAILDNADNRWGKYVGRADRKIRLLDILNRARTKHPNPLTSLTFSGLSAQQEVEQDVQFVYGFKDFLDSTIEVEWAIEDFIERGGMGMVAASPGVGKTQISIQLAIACALGIEFLGWKPARAMKMTVLSLEMSAVALKKFMQTIAGHYDEDQIKMLQENLTIIPLGETLPLHKEQSRTFINGLLDKIQPDGLIIDSLIKLAGQKLEEESVGIINHHLGVMRKRYGCFVWLIHHNRKANGDNSQPDSLDDIYGSVFIAAEMTAVLLLYKKRGQKQIAVINVKNRLHEERPMFLVERDEHLFFHEVNPVTLFTGLTDVKAGEDNEPEPVVPDKTLGEDPANFGL